VLEPGTILGAKYRLDVEIGRGGMGSVWRATRLDLGTELAIKVMSGDALNKPGGLDRFTREAKAAASLTSPHVVRIIDFGADTAGGLAFMAMELLVGESLSARISSRKVLEPQHVARVITQVARALAQAHAAGIVHRDLKPGNIFLVHNADDELAKLLDFGIAKAGDGLSTATGSVLGTPYYMSPEQVNCAKDIDHRTDLWSLGVIACECMTGQRPFSAETLSELAMKIALGRAEVPSRLGAVPLGFDAWFARATQVDRTQRFQSATELASALAGVVGQTSGVRVATSSAELGLAATLASAEASVDAQLNSLPAAPSSFDAKLSTTSAGSTTVPSRPAAERSSRVSRSAVLVALAAAIGGGVYFAGFTRREGARSESARPSAAQPPPPVAQSSPATAPIAPSGAPEAPARSPVSAPATVPAVVPAPAPATPEAPPVAARGGASKPQPEKAATRAAAARKDARAGAERSRRPEPPVDGLDAYDLQ
jgi:serine/threonine-protein kinase